MTNKDFKIKVDELLRPIGFKNKGNYWRFKTQDVEKVVYLQKSNFSNLYYFNYGFNLKGLSYDGVSLHIATRLQQSDVFDLESSMDTRAREQALEKIIEQELIPALQRVNTENDILIFIKSLPTTNGIPIKVKEYLHVG